MVVFGLGITWEPVLKEEIVQESILHVEAECDIRSYVPEKLISNCRCSGGGGCLCHGNGNVNG